MSSLSPSEARERVGVQRFAVAEQADHDREADGRFRRRHRHHEEHDDLAVRRAERPAERDERQVDGIQHDLDRQENRDQVAPHEHAGRADGEENRREHEVVIERHHHGCSRRAITTAPTIATRMSTDVTSNANAYSVNNNRPIAFTELTAPLLNAPDSPPPAVSAQTSSTTSATA